MSKNYDGHFKLEWMKDPDFKDWLSKEGESARCNIYAATFLMVKHDGLNGKISFKL